MTSPEFLIIDDPVAKADLARIQAMVDRLRRAMLESRDAFVGRAERGPLCPIMRLEDLVLPDPPLPAAIGIPQGMRGFLAGVPRQLEAVLAAHDFGLPAWPRTRWLHHAGLRWSP